MMRTSSSSHSDGGGGGVLQVRLVPLQQPMVLMLLVSTLVLLGHHNCGVVNGIRTSSNIMNENGSTAARVNITINTHKSHASAFNGTRWAVLVAGSRDFENYRHQADICHAYQILRRGGIKEENIIVFMYDDIAFNPLNPRPGVIINKPNGGDVYAGVPKDYTGDSCTVNNFLSVILGNKSALTGGSGKVLDSGPNDHIFIYYADHGSAGFVCMASDEYLYANDLIKVLKKKHEAKAYKNMVIYMEACESGSMFQGILPGDMSIYAVTAANAVESSWAAYCSGGSFPPPPLDFPYTCLGDVFSISWLEDADSHDLTQETLSQQYSVVRRRTGFDYGTDPFSHVLQFGDLQIASQFASHYMGDTNTGTTLSITNPMAPTTSATSTNAVLTQHDASLLHFRLRYEKAPEGSEEKMEAHKRLVEVLGGAKHVEQSIHMIALRLFGANIDRYQNVTNLGRAQSKAQDQDQPLVQDWDRFKLLVETYEKQCGRISWYGKKYTRAIANMCNAGVTLDQMDEASAMSCAPSPTPSINLKNNHLASNN